MDVKFMINSRKLVRCEITKTFNRITERDQTESRHDDLSVLARLRILQSEVKELDLKIGESLFDPEASDEDCQEEYDIGVSYAMKILSCITTLESSLKASEIQYRPRSLGLGAEEISRNQLKLPQVPLPEYGRRDGEDLNKFLTNFEHIIDKYSLSSYEKYIFLQKQLANEPLTLVKSLEIGKQNYDDAKDLLQQAFASPLTQQYESIRQLSEMRLSYGDDPYEYIGKMRVLTEAFKSLKIDAETVLQYFFWRGMNEGFQNQLIQISNSNKPSLSEINTHLFDATERYLSVSKKLKAKREQAVSVDGGINKFSAAGMATHVSYDGGKSKVQYCSLCSGRGEKVVSHSTFNCSVYQTPATKRERLGNLHGCIKCGNLSHRSDQCRFRFNKKCFHCSGEHFSFLCDGGLKEETQTRSQRLPKFPNAKGPQSNAKVIGGAAWIGGTRVSDVSALGTQIGEDVIVPTFSLTVDGHVLRGMRDSGCQPNFISQRVADELKLNIVDSKFTLTIHGFNASEEYETSIVECPFNPNEPPIRAICVPSIRTRLVLPKLGKIVDHFVSKGYKFADEFLTETDNVISDLDLMLGNMDAQVLPQREVVFGAVPCSMYSVTPKGVMLFGSVQRMLSNLSHLPEHGVSSMPGFVSVAGGVGKVASSEAELFDSDQGELDFAPVTVLDSSGRVVESALERAVEAALEEQCRKVFNYDEASNSDVSVESDDKIIQYVLDKTERSEDGRLIMPLIWNSRVCDMLGRNYHLSKQVLKSNLKRLQHSPTRLEMYDEVFRSQESEGIIERISNLEQFMGEHPTASFLPHMGVFKLDRESTKCRVVYLSNLCEKDFDKERTICHNQALLSGPSLNRKLSVAILQLRFDRYLLSFDLSKAFLGIALNPVDQNRLLTLWFRNVKKGDFALVAYRNLRLAFGLRCSPALLMLALFKMLVLDADADPVELKDLKRLIYDLVYMDNGSITANDPNYIKWAYSQLPKIFTPYRFSLQQISTNVKSLQQEVDVESREETVPETKLFGLRWNRDKDTLSTLPLKLNAVANTKRMIISTIASNFDVFQFGGPLLNRARLFAHEIQCDRTVDWDDPISEERHHEWRNICKQVNDVQPITIERFVGRRDGRYRLLAFTDASMSIYGVVLFIQDLSSKKLSFLFAKNRLVNKQLESKSIPSLEFHAVVLGAETLLQTFRELTGKDCVIPLNIVKLSLFSDSMVSLNWINSYVHRLDKMQKKSAFVLNRLEKLSNLCEAFPIHFAFIAGVENPADCITRSLSYKQLRKSNYLNGPADLDDLESGAAEGFQFVVPHRSGEKTSPGEIMVTSVGVRVQEEPLIPVDRYSSFHRLVGVQRLVLKFVNNLKICLRLKFPEKFGELTVYDSRKDNMYAIACNQVILFDQRKEFVEEMNFFDKRPSSNKDMPNLVKQVNLFRDKDGLLRVYSKFERWRDHAGYYFPILLSKDSPLTKIIISDIHCRSSHSGCYSVLNEFRKRFYVAHHFSVIKKVLRDCFACRRLNSRVVKINQSAYRDFRVDPPSIPFRYIFIDHFGPYWVKRGTSRSKVWVLCITCMWSRAINLRVSVNLTVGEFLKALQWHVYEFGLPELILSDLGSQFVAGSNIILDLLKDPQTQRYLEEHNMKPVKFEQYVKGCSSLGSLVESCVKLSKRLIYGAIKKSVLELTDFQFMVAQTVHLLNKRPIAFKEALRDNSALGTFDVPYPITPEMLLKGYELPSVSVLPTQSEDSDPDWRPVYSADSVRDGLSALNKCRARLTETYEAEFLAQLREQASREKDRFKPVKHQGLEKGDVVLLRETNCKVVDFPLGIVEEVYTNFQGETTAAKIRKGRTGEIVRRHASSVIPLVRQDDRHVEEDKAVTDSVERGEVGSGRPKRPAAERCLRKTREMYDHDLL